MGEEAMAKALASRVGETSRDWQRNGVPCEVVGPAFELRITEAQLREQELPNTRKGETKTVALARVPMPDPYPEIEERLRAIFWRKREEWNKIAGLIEVISKDVYEPKAVKVPAKSPSKVSGRRRE